MIVSVVIHTAVEDVELSLSLSKLGGIKVRVVFKYPVIWSVLLDAV